MRVGLDLLPVADPTERLALAAEADRLGLWAVLVGGPPGTEAVEAATVARHTASVHVAVMFDGSHDHPLTVAEEVSVLDHLSQRRALAVIDGEQEVVDHVARLLAGQIIDDVALSPPPAQTIVPVWAAAEVTRVRLSGDLGRDGQVIDRHRDDGCTHLFVEWPRSVLVLARHLVTRAIGPGFPVIVAEMADRIDPPADTGRR